MTVLITGASRGIGAQMAREYAKNGYKVAINYNKSEDEALALKDEIVENGGIAEVFKADVSSMSEVKSMVENAIKKLGAIDVLVNNAGISQQKLFCDITENDYDKMFDVNMKGVFNCSKAVILAMIHRKSGVIINISSMWGQAGGSCEVHYSASKAAIIGFTKALAKEVAPSNIRVNCICPGVIDTEMNDNLDEHAKEELKKEIPMGVIGQPSDIAKTALFLTGDDSFYITGQIIGVNGGIII